MVFVWDLTFPELKLIDVIIRVLSLHKSLAL